MAEADAVAEAFGSPRAGGKGVGPVGEDVWRKRGRERVSGEQRKRRVRRRG